MKKYLLSIDQGTTGSRVALYSEDGVLEGYAYSEHRQIYPKPGWVEHDPLEIWVNVKKLIREVIEKTRIDPGDIAGIGVTNQRETIVAWDPETGKPYYNAIVWQCRRTSKLVEKLKPYSRMIREKTGLLPDPYFSATKIWWLLENIPGLREKAEENRVLFGTIDSWIIWNLTRGSRDVETPGRGGSHVTDYSNASRTMLFNIHRLEWDPELLEISGNIPENTLPEPLPSSYIYGYTGPEISDFLFNGRSIPVSGDAGDQQAALFGQTCFREGMVKTTYGTGSFTLMNTGGRIVYSSKGLLTTIYYSLEKGKAHYALEGSNFIAGAAVKWLRDNLGLIKDYAETEKIALSLESSEGVYFVPALSGLGTPYWDMYARGLIIGLTGKTTRSHIVRAVLESIAYIVYDIVETMIIESGLDIKDMRVDGGASKNNFLMQFQADILSKRIIRPKILETTSLGAAFLAGLSVDVWRSLEELEEIWEIDRIYEPSIDEESRRKLLEGWREAVKRSMGWARIIED